MRFKFVFFNFWQWSHVRDKWEKTLFFVQKKDKIQSPDQLETIYNETKPNGKYFEH